MCLHKTEQLVGYDSYCQQNLSMSAANQDSVAQVPGYNQLLAQLFKSLLIAISAPTLPSLKHSTSAICSHRIFFFNQIKWHPLHCLKSFSASDLLLAQGIVLEKDSCCNT